MNTTKPSRSTTSTSARRSSPASTAPRCCWPAAARPSATCRRTSSRRACPGFEEAGGMEGPGLDFIAKPEGDPALAAEYFKKAGYALGQVRGRREEILMVGTSEGVGPEGGRDSKENFEKLGFKVRLRLVTQDAMYTKFCNVPEAEVDVCPNVGWFKDFSDAADDARPDVQRRRTSSARTTQLARARRARDQQGDDEGRAPAPTRPSARRRGPRSTSMVTEQAPAVDYSGTRTPTAAVQERQRRREQVLRPMGPRLHVPEVGNAEPARSGPAAGAARAAAATSPHFIHGRLHRPPPASGWSSCCSRSP